MDRAKIVQEILGWPGAMISGSKSGYDKAHPKHRVFFNANLYGHDAEKLWYGDLDLTLSAKQLETVASQLGEAIYVTREMPFRFSTPSVADLEQATLGEHPSAVKFGGP